MTTTGGNNNNKNNNSNDNHDDETGSSATDHYQRASYVWWSALLVIVVTTLYSTSSSWRHDSESLASSLSSSSSSELVVANAETGVGDENKDEDDKDDDRIVLRRSRDDDAAVTVESIAFIGERNSGTKWIVDELRSCFGEDLRVRDKLSRFKHWFQYHDPDNDDRVRGRTLVVAQFRDPYHWALSMRHKPHHSPAHYQLDWRTFLTKPWTTERRGHDQLVTNRRDRVCNAKFRYDEIVSCVHRALPERYRDNDNKAVKGINAEHPMYELRQDGSGEPFASVLDLRAAKIRNFLSVSTFPYVTGLVTVRYEDLVANGTAFLIREVADRTGVEPRCERTTPPQAGRVVRELERDFVDHLNEHADWDAEALVGYEKRTTST